MQVVAAMGLCLPIVARPGIGRKRLAIAAAGGSII
jgi:hypothetical protein